MKARILVSQSHYLDALSLLETEPPASLAAMDIFEQRRLYQGIGHRLARQFKDAERDFDAAEQLAKPLPPSYMCLVLISRADLRVDEKQYEQAGTDYRDALALARRNSLKTAEANSLADLARLATLQTHFDEALDLYRQALGIAQALHMQGNVSTILGNLGWSYFELGDFESSFDFYKKGGDASANTGQSGYSAYWFSGLANAQMALHDYQGAERLALSTLQRAYELKNPDTAVQCLNTLAEVMLRTDQLAKAKAYNEEALRVEQDGDSSMLDPDTLKLSGQIAAAEGRFHDADQRFQQVLSDPNADPPLHWESRAGLARLRDAEGETRDARAQYQRAIAAIETARCSIHHDELRLSFLSTGIEVYGQYMDFLLRHNLVSEALHLADLSRARTLSEGLSSGEPCDAPRASHSVLPQQVAKRLGAALLFYWVGEGQSHLWVVTPEKTAHLTLPGAEQIDSLVKAYREALQGTRDPLESADADGQKLYSMLIAPAKNLIPAHSKVIVLPDGKLYDLNFETLIVPGPKPHYWIEDVTLSTGSSLSLLASAAARPSPKEKTLYLVGDTIPPNDNFPKLTQAAEEMKSIEKYFPASRTKTLSGAGATPSAYLDSNPQRYSYIHFVTHGTASRARPLESAVILSKEQNDDSYKLYARDILKKRLSAALVTISACNTSGTRTFSGEGLVGLSWAFLRAGAHNVIGALWEVSDTATPQLMNALYDDLSHGKDPAAALRDAQLSLLHSESVFRKARYWAPFQVYVGS